MRSRWWGLLPLAFLGCSGSSNSSSPLDGNWGSVDAYGSGAGFVIRSDGTYTFTVVDLTSNAQGQAEAYSQVEAGTFTSTSNTITFTPNEWTCPSPDPVYTLSRTRSREVIWFSAFPPAASPR
jgi:hypothetical protein